MPIKTSKQALREARRRWGKRGAAQDSGWRNAGTPEERKAASDELRVVSEQIQQLQKRRSELLRISCRYQYSVGRIVGAAGFLAFEVRGQGDSWDDAFASAEAHDKAMVTPRKQPL